MSWPTGASPTVVQCAFGALRRVIKIGRWYGVDTYTSPYPVRVNRRYDIGAFSFALLYFKEDPKLHLSQLQVAILVGQFNLVAALGCLIAGTVSDALGRRTSLMLGNLLNVVGTIIFAASNSFSSMFLGRFVMGVTRRPPAAPPVPVHEFCLVALPALTHPPTHPPREWV